jgi:creatinine amidohydrolase
MLVVRDVVQSLAVHGFRQFFFINGHGGNIATVTAAFDELYSMRSLGEAAEPVRCRMRFWSGPRAAAVAAALYGDANGGHATCAEVSLAQFYQPRAGPGRMPARARRQCRTSIHSSVNGRCMNVAQTKFIE